MMNNSGYSEAALGLGDEVDDMPSTEKDLAEDAPWKKIQQNTFTRWCNEHLKCVGKRLTDLQRDLSDGLRLIALLEVLSQKRMYRKFHPRPNFRQMKLENVSVALEFLEREHIKLVSIGQCGQAGRGGEGDMPGERAGPWGRRTQVVGGSGELRQGRGRPPGTGRGPWPRLARSMDVGHTGTACTPACRPIAASGGCPGVQTLPFLSPPAQPSRTHFHQPALTHCPLSCHRAIPAHA